jgi:hypothetical protein
MRGVDTMNLTWIVASPRVTIRYAHSLVYSLAGMFPA